MLFLFDSRPQDFHAFWLANATIQLEFISQLPDNLMLRSSWLHADVATYVG